MNDDVEGHLRDLRVAPDAPYQGLGPAAARVRAAERRRHQRGALVAAALVLLVAVVAVVVGFERDATDRLQPARPPAPSSPPYTFHGEVTETPSAAASASSATSLGQIDWRNSVMNLPTNDTCPHRRVQFTDGQASVPPWHYTILRLGEPTYADVTRDGRTDAIVIIECWGNADVGGPETRFLIAAFTGNAKGGPTPLGVVDGMQAYIDPTINTRDDLIIVDFNPASGGEMKRSYRWNGKTFARVS